MDYIIIGYNWKHFLPLINKIKVLRQRPTFPRSLPRSIIGAGGLNFRVRNGNECFPSAIATVTPIKMKII